MSEKASLLLVDDVPENIDVLRGILSDHYRLKVAIHGAKALKSALKSPPDLILLDIMMPDMDGYEVCQRLKADPRTQAIPIIFVTAKGEVADEAKGFALGAVDYIVKPVSPAIVLARVATHLALYDQNRALEDKVRERTQELEHSREQIIHRLGRAAEYKDNETGLHVMRMSHYSFILAKASGFSEEAANLLLTAAPMHDIGKIGIPDRVLLKPGRLDEDEWALMHQHPKFGSEIIGQHNNRLLKLAAEVALSHHEKWDGTGYPNGLQGEDIPIAARIVAIADVFDALTTKRPYKDAWPVEKAVSVIMQDAGTHFDPALAALLPDCLDEMLKIREQFSE